MDPNETLRILREIVSEYENDNYDGPDWHDRTEEAVSLFSALDGWISNGGFLPDAWVEHRCDHDCDYCRG